MKRYLLAHDLGTSGNKATLFSTEGRLVKSATVGYDSHFFNNNWAEQNPEDWWRAVAESTRAIMTGVDAGEIAVICFSGQMMGCLCVDAQGRPLRPHLLYCDQRAVEEEARILSNIDAREFYRIVGHRASASYSAEKLMWVQKHEPELYARTHKMLHAKDCLNFQLTGVLATEYSDASGTNLLDLKSLAWSPKLVQAAGLDAEKLPRLLSSTDVVGELTREAGRSPGPEGGHPGGGRRRGRGVRRGGGRLGEAGHHLQLPGLLLLDRHHQRRADPGPGDAHLRLGPRRARDACSPAAPCRRRAAPTPG